MFKECTPIHAGGVCPVIEGETEGPETDNTGRYWSMVQDIAERASERERGNNGRYLIEDFANDIAQELTLKLPAELARYDPNRGVPLDCYLRQRLDWHARKLIRDERKWRRLTEEYDPNKTVEIGVSHGSRKVGAEKLVLRKLGPEEESPMFPRARSLNLQPDFLLHPTAIDLLLRSDAWNQLEARDRQMVWCHHALGINQQDIATHLGIDQSRVSRRIEAAIKKIQVEAHKSTPPQTSSKWKEIPGNSTVIPKPQGTDMQLLTLAEVARRLGLSEKTAREVAKQFPTVKVGKRIRYREDALAEFIARGGATSAERPAA
jgi:RNA polymerase sigma factor (sigma-70 family)